MIMKIAILVAKKGKLKKVFGHPSDVMVPHSEDSFLTAFFTVLCINTKIFSVCHTFIKNSFLRYSKVHLIDLLIFVNFCLLDV